ncbi:hypothetical protein MRX96_013200 [Rhipicephalus microplus]
MASFVIQPPDAFNFSSPNKWPKWKQRFERFRTSSGLCVKPKQHQVDALLYIMAAEHFQKQMAYILQGISRVVCHMDDILIWGSNCQEHNEPLRNVLQALAKAGVTLNDSKYVFNVQRLTFLEH